jgi:hypothetical protein
LRGAKVASDASSSSSVHHRTPAHALGVDRRWIGARLERRHPHEHEHLALVDGALVPRKRVASRPDRRPRLVGLEACLLAQLAPQRGLGVLALVDAAAGRQPAVDTHVLVDPADEEDALVGIEHHRARGVPDLGCLHRRQSSSPG